MSYPNLSYEAFEDFVIRLKDKHMPMKTVRFDKHEHKMTKWVTTGIIKSIKFRDKLYKQLKSIRVNSQEYSTLKINLKPYNQIFFFKSEWLRRIIIMNNLTNIKDDQKNLGYIKGRNQQVTNTSYFPSHFITYSFIVSDKDT